MSWPPRTRVGSRPQPSTALDVTDIDATRVVDDVVARHGRIDVLVNHAGGTQVGALEETTEQELRYLFALLRAGSTDQDCSAAHPPPRWRGCGADVQRRCRCPASPVR